MRNASERKDIRRYEKAAKLRETNRINFIVAADSGLASEADSLAGGVADRSMISPVSVRAAGSFANGGFVGVGFVGCSITVESVIYLLRYVGFFHHLDEVIWAVTHYVIVHFKTNVSLTFTIRFHKCITCKWVCKDVASGEEIVEPHSTCGGGHCRDNEVDPIS